ncbi:MAG: DUF4838 domain-containing protein [Chloroflexi bacterium]|nr:DUF4838 domain-containing protein [Chloroflexota bacterium]
MVEEIGTAGSLVLAAQGRAQAYIVLPAAASPVEQFAARELAEHLQAMTGATFTIQADTDEGEGIHVLLGIGTDALQHGGHPAPEQSGAEEYLVSTVGQELVLAGSGAQGLLAAVYVLLEDVLGCRWYTQTVRHIPRRPVLTVPSLHCYGRPSLEYRAVYYACAFEQRFALHNRLNGQGHALPAELGGHRVIFPFVHTFDALVPATEHFASHPEYYALVDGRRQPTQLCLSHPEVFTIALARVCRWIEEHPEAGIFSVSQNDSDGDGGYCTCALCAAVDVREETPAGSVLAFVNRIAGAVEQRYPGKLIETLAYQYTVKPPRYLHPRANVVIRCAFIEACYCHSLEETERAAPIRAALEGWGAIAQHLYVWHYAGVFSHYLLPLGNLRRTARDLQYFARHGVTGIFVQGQEGEPDVSALAELHAWVYAKLLWHPEQDLDTLIREFVHAVYGGAAPVVLAYLDLLERLTGESPEHISCFPTPQTLHYLTPSVLERLTAALAPARDAADSAVSQEHVAWLLDSLEYARLIRFPPYVVHTNRLEPAVPADRSVPVAQLVSRLQCRGVTGIRIAHRVEELWPAVEHMTCVHPLVDLENEFLQIRIVPSVLGKVHSVTDRRSGRSYVYARDDVVERGDRAIAWAWENGAVAEYYERLTWAGSSYIAKLLPAPDGTRLVLTSELVTANQGRLTLRKEFFLPQQAQTLAVRYALVNPGATTLLQTGDGHFQATGARFSPPSRSVFCWPEQCAPLADAGTTYPLEDDVPLRLVGPALTSNRITIRGSDAGAMLAIERLEHVAAIRLHWQRTRGWLRVLVSPHPAHDLAPGGTYHWGYALHFAA